MILSIVIIILFPGVLATLLLTNARGSTRVPHSRPAPYAINEKSFVSIGGVKQGMFIRGCDTTKPVLLFLHGGPGMPTYFLTERYPTGLENEFIVCYWEQRGAGLSFDSRLRPETITVDQLTKDAIDVAQYLCRRFGREKVYLMGHSWGSLIGIRVAAKAPELFHAYIGVAQISNQAASEKIALEYMISEYTARGSFAMAEQLKKHRFGSSHDSLVRYFKSPLRDRCMHELGIGTMRGMTSVIKGIFIPAMRSRAYTLRERITIWRAKLFLATRTRLIDELLSTSLPDAVPRLAVPVFFISGSHDYTVNHTLSGAYLNSLNAPVKVFFLLNGSAHSPMHEEPEAFIMFIKKEVLGTPAIH